MSKRTHPNTSFHPTAVPEDLKKWAETVTRLGAGWQDAFIYFKHEESGIGPALAQQFRALLTS